MSVSMSSTQLRHLVLQLLDLILQLLDLVVELGLALHLVTELLDLCLELCDQSCLPLLGSGLLLSVGL